MEETEFKVVAVNRQARHEYEIQETIEAGLALTGTEIKSVRAASANIRDGFAAPTRRGELWLYNVHISPYEKGNRFNVDPRRPRKLLLHRRQIDHLLGKSQQKGLTLIPLRIYLKRGLAKVELALARGRRIYDKRRAIAERDLARERERELRRYRT
jgi:SsrA-binding protein